MSTREERELFSGEQEEQHKLPSGIITKVEQQKRRGSRRYNLYIEEQFALSVHEDVMIKYRLLKGEYVEAEGLQQILDEDERHRAYLDAIRLLSSRLRSAHEIRERLKQKGYGPEQTASTIFRLEREGYLNDSLFAEMLTKQRLESQKKGRHWIKQELKQKGIGKDQIGEAISSVDPETEYEMAAQLAAKRYGSELAKDPLKARRRIAAFLARRGYPGGVVSRVLGSLPRGEVLEDDWDETGDETEDSFD